MRDASAHTVPARVLSLALAGIFFWISLGVGTNLSDTRYWVESTWSILYLEWGYLLLFVLLSGMKPFLFIWKEYRFIVILSILWGSTVLLSVFLSPWYNWENPLVLMRLMETFTHAFFFFSIWGSLRFFAIKTEWVYLAIITATMIVLGWFVFFSWVHPVLAGSGDIAFVRSNAIPINTLIRRVGYQVEVAALILLPLLSKTNYKRYVLVLLLLFLGFLLWLGVRASILGVIVAAGVWGYLNRQKFGVRSLTGVSVSFAVLLFILGYVGLFNTGYLATTVTHTLHAPTLNTLSSGRIEVWELLLDQLRGHWLLGTGPQSYFFYPHRDQMVIHAHNFLLQFLGEWGVVGAGIALFFLFKAVRYGLQIHRGLKDERKYTHAAAGLVLLALMVTGFFGGIFYFAQTSVYLALFFALWITPGKAPWRVY